MNASASTEADIVSVFDSFPDSARDLLLDMRALIFSTADKTDNAGDVVEALKWGQPSYLTVRPKSGSTIRLGVNSNGQPTLYCHCQTSLISEFRDLYPTQFEFEGNRAMVMKPGRELPREELAHCVALALTYHQRKRKS